MKILLMTQHLNIGGVPKYVLNLTKGLVENGHSVLLASAGGVWENTIVQNDRCTFVRIPIKTKFILSPKVFVSFYKLFQLIKSEKPDVIHANTRVCQFLATLLSFFTKIPVVCTYHGYYKAHFFRKLLTFKGNANIAVSNAVKTHMIDDLKLNEKNIHVVFNGIDIQDYDENKFDKKALRVKYQIPCDAYVVGTVARLTPEKNIECLIAAYAEFASICENSSLIICGSGREYEKLRREVDALNLNDRVLFFNGVDIKEIISTMDIFVLPSIQEGFGLSLAEAQALKIPVIASNIGGMTDIVENEKTGLTFKSNNPSDLAGKIQKYFNNSQLTKSCSRNAYESVCEKFSLEVTIKDTINVYKKVVLK